MTNGAEERTHSASPLTRHGAPKGHKFINLCPLGLWHSH